MDPLGIQASIFTAHVPLDTRMTLANNILSVGLLLSKELGGTLGNIGTTTRLCLENMRKSWSIFATIEELGPKIPYYRRNSGSQSPNGCICGPSGIHSNTNHQ